MLPANLEALPGLRRNGAGWMACCPVHDDRNPSLSLTLAEDGKVLAHCHAGCDQAAVAAALDLHAEPRPGVEWTPHGDAVAVYHYVDEAGRALFDVCRTADKQFPQRRPDPVSRTGWRWTLGDVRRVPYRLPEVIAAVRDGRTVYVAEGEKDVEALRAVGKVATCNPGGAGKWRVEYGEHLREATVMVCADKDKPGQQHARTVAASLHKVDATVWVLEAADPHKDVAAHLGAGLPLNALNVTHRPDQPARPDLAEDVHEFLAASDEPYDWLIEGFLERWERVILTGAEGAGKSMAIRQMAVCMAAGLHPFTFTRRTPVTVLVIDCENNDRQNRRKIRPMVEQAEREGARVPDGGLRIIHRPNGLDLTDTDDAAWLIERVTAHSPDVLVLGPLYQLHRQNMNDELAARQLTHALRLAQAAAVSVRSCLRRTPGTATPSPGPCARPARRCSCAGPSTATGSSRSSWPTDRAPARRGTRRWN